MSKQNGTAQGDLRREQTAGLGIGGDEIRNVRKQAETAAGGEARALGPGAGTW